MDLLVLMMFFYIFRVDADPAVPFKTWIWDILLFSKHGYNWYKLAVTIHKSHSRAPRDVEILKIDQLRGVQDVERGTGRFGYSMRTHRHQVLQPSALLFPGS